MSLETQYKKADSLFDLAKKELQFITSEDLRRTEELYFLANQSVMLLLSEQLKEAYPIINKGKFIAKQVGNIRMKIRFEILLSSYYYYSKLFYKSYNQAKFALKYIEQTNLKLNISDYIDFKTKSLTIIADAAKNYYLNSPEENKIFLDSTLY